MSENVSWDDYIERYLIREGCCYAGGLANREDCVFYAAAPVEGDLGWEKIYADDHEEKILLNDGETEDLVMICESANLLEVVEKKNSPSGLWVAGLKYRVIQHETDETTEFPLVNILAARSRAGLYISITPKGTLVMGLFSEDCKPPQKPGNAKKAVTAFAEWLAKQGY